jgi:hypothetical protein
MNFDECAKRFVELRDKIKSKEYSQNENYHTVELEFNKVFIDTIKTSIIEKKFFSSSPLELFIRDFTENLELLEKEEIDFDENEYIKRIYLYQCEIFSSNRHKNRETIYNYIAYLNDENYKLFSSIIRKRIEYLEKLLFKKGIEVITTKPYGDSTRVNREFKKHINIMIENDSLKPIKPTNKNTLKWTGEQTEFIELFKALILNGSITGTGNQLDKINQLASLLNFEINNPYKLLNDIKTTRNNGSETLFLDKLKKTFYDYITLEKIK